MRRSAGLAEGDAAGSGKLRAHILTIHSTCVSHKAVDARTGSVSLPSHCSHLSSSCLVAASALLSFAVQLPCIAAATADPDGQVRMEQLRLQVKCCAHAVQPTKGRSIGIAVADISPSLYVSSECSSLTGVDLVASDGTSRYNYWINVRHTQCVASACRSPFPFS